MSDHPPDGDSGGADARHEPTAVTGELVLDNERTRLPAVTLPRALAVTPTVSAGELVDRLRVIKEAAEQAMTDGVDYGKVPGTDKPTLLKPGAEKLSVLFQLDVQLQNEKMWEHPHLTVVSRATVFHAPTGSRLGYGEGVCSTREKKYAKRNAQRTCPECGQPQVRKSKKDPEFYCWAKQGGCGAKFPLNDERITSQPTGDVENPDLPDTWNTVVKMAEKRARVDAVLAVTGASAIFTQDAEDMGSSQTAQSPVADADHPFGPPYDAAIGREAGAACVKLAGGGASEGVALWKLIQGDLGGYMPQAAAVALIKAAKTENLVGDVEAPAL